MYFRLVNLSLKFGKHLSLSPHMLGFDWNHLECGHTGLFSYNRVQPYLFWSFTTMSLRILFFWDMTLHQWEVTSQCFKAAQCPHLQGSKHPRRILGYSAFMYKHTVLPHSVGIHLTSDTESCPRRMETSGCRPLQCAAYFIAITLFTVKFSWVINHVKWS